jgi:hypothetical protein
MSERIRHIGIEQRRLDAAEAELLVSVELTPGPSVEVRGRWVGPRCAWQSTLEVAYPLRPLDSAGKCRVIIPDPARWEPATPFLYAGIVEFWADGQRLERRTLEHGLATLSLGPQGLLCNRKKLELRGVRCQELTETLARTLRGQGINLLLSEGRDPDLERAAERFGFLVIRRGEGQWELHHVGAPAQPLLGREGEAGGAAFLAEREANHWTLRNSAGVVFGRIE